MCERDRYKFSRAFMSSALGYTAFFCQYVLLERTCKGGNDCIELAMMDSERVALMCARGICERKVDRERETERNRERESAWWCVWVSEVFGQSVNKWILCVCTVIAPSM